MKQADIGLIRKLTLDCFLLLIKSLIATYDLISQPICYFKYQVARKRREVDRIRSVRVNPNDPSSAWRQIDIAPHQVDIERRIDSFTTYDQMMKASYQENSSFPCYGYRQVIEEHQVKRPDGSGKLLRQVKLSEYKWCTYGQFERQIEAARRGFLRQGVRSGQRVILFADTRPEWQICSQALIRLGAIVATMYSTLGIDGIVHTVNETGANLVVTQRDKVDRLIKLCDKLPKLEKIVYFETSLYLPRELGGHDEYDEREFRHFCTTTSTPIGAPTSVTPTTHVPNGVGGGGRRSSKKSTANSNSNNKTKGVTETASCNGGEAGAAGQDDDCATATATTRSIECVSFCELIRSGLELASASKASLLTSLEMENNNGTGTGDGNGNGSGNGGGNLSKRTKESIAVIMYTSGSTGIPKGVLISHGNIMATIKSFSYVTKDFVTNPRANTSTAYLPLAHIFEFCIESVMLYHGVKFGFASPHTLTDKSPGLLAGQQGDLSQLQPTVMIIVPLILDRIVQGVKQAIGAQSYFKAQLINYLIDYKIYWHERHYETPLVDKLICSKIAAALGGKARYVICGSAPLSAQTQVFCRNALCLKLPQGFGTTETCAATSCQLFDDQSTQNVGLPVSGAQIKLEPWLEGNYTPEDKPNPRGEIVVGGEMIAQGYYNLEQLTREAFYVDQQGTRWYRTGDIGEFLPNGQLKIIDRKKDLVKLQNGEYISLGRVESTLKSNPYTDNFCVYANSNYNYVIALGPANELALRKLAQQIVDELEPRSSSSSVPSSRSSPSSSSPSSPSLSIKNNKRNNNNQLLLLSSSTPNGRGSSLKSLTPTSLSAMSSSNHLNLTMTTATPSEDDDTPLLSDQRRLQALIDLKQVLASYESDLLNNNDCSATSGAAAAAADGGSERSASEHDGAINGDVNISFKKQQREPLVAASGGCGGVNGGVNGSELQQQAPGCQAAGERLNKLCDNKLIQERVLEHVAKMAKERNLLSLEVPKKLLLLAEEWTEDKNLVTAAMKIRRNYIYKRYEKELEHMYASNQVA